MKPADFLLAAWGLHAQDGYYFCLSTKVDGSRGRWKDHFFEWPIERKLLKRFLLKYPDTEYHVYFCPTPFRERVRRKEMVLGSRLLWADLDEAHPQQCDPIPQIAWESSPGRYAALWVLNEFHTPLEIEPVNKNMTYSSGADHGGWDLSQVLRIPGLRNLKYKKRNRAKLMWFTDNEYPIDDIPQFIQMLDPREVLKKYRRKLKKSTLKLLTARQATKGKRSDVIWKLENLLSEEGLESDEIFTLIKGSVWNKFEGRRDEDKQLRRELSKIEAKRPALSKRSKPRNDEDSDDEEEEDEEAVVCMASVEPESVSWLWYPYIPQSKLTIIEGDPGLGKSFLTMALTKHISRGIKLPETKRGKKGKVLLMSMEDGIADTIRPRLDSVGADVSRVFAYKSVIIFDDDGIDDIDKALTKYKPKMLIVDPLVAYLGAGVDLHKANETREVMAKLGLLAEKHRCAIVCVRHLRKGGSDKSIYRGLGSIDFTAAARSVLLVGKDPHDPDKRAIAHIKCNIAATGPTILYELRANMKRPFKWAGVSDLTADDLLKSPKDGGGKSERELAQEFLSTVLETRPKRKKDLVREAEARGVSKSGLLKAKRSMDIQTEKKKGGEIWWSLV